MQYLRVVHQKLWVCHVLLVGVASTMCCWWVWRVPCVVGGCGECHVLLVGVVSTMCWWWVWQVPCVVVIEVNSTCVSPLL